MDPNTQLRASFEEVADALESYFEGLLGTECGMSCSSFLHALRDVITHEDYSDGRVERLAQLANHADKMTLQFFMYYLKTRGYQVRTVEPASSRYSGPYDPGPMKQ